MKSIILQLLETINKFITFARLKPFTIITPGDRSRERYRRIVLTIGSSFFSKIISAITLLVSVPLTLNYLGTERYGMWMTISSIITFLQFADLGIGNGLLNAVADAHGKDNIASARRSISNAFFSLVGISIVLATLFIPVYYKILWEEIYNVSTTQAISEAGPSTLVFFIFFLANIPLGVVQRVQHGYQEGYIDNLWQALGKLIGLGGLLIMIRMEKDLHWLIFAITGSPVLALCLNYFYYFYIRKPKIRPSWHLINRFDSKAILQTGFLFFILQLVLATVSSIKPILLTQIIGPDAVTEFSVTNQMFLFLPMTTSLILFPLWPAYGEAISRGDRVWAWSTFQKSLRVSIIFTLPSSLLLVILGPKLLQYWTGSIISSSWSLLIALGINSVLLYGWGYPISNFLNGIGEVAIQVYCAVLMFFANIGLSIFLIKSIGISGVVWGTVFTYTILVFIPISIHLYKLKKKILLDQNMRSTISNSHTTEEAVNILRNDPQNKELIQNSYLDKDTFVAANRFMLSDEFNEVLNILNLNIENKVVLDLGAGSGIAAFSFAQKNAKHVFALDPDLSNQIGCGAAQRISQNLPLSVICAIGERIPINNNCVDIIYLRQVLHHVTDLQSFLSECARILHPGGLLLATREHVISNKTQREIFLANHPVHKITSGENAYCLEEYINAIRNAGFSLQAVLGPFDTIVNAYPTVKSKDMLKNIPEIVLKEKYGIIGKLLSYLPGVKNLVMKRLNTIPGRLYSFLGKLAG
jgi:O-antigen/teichoic acid export membrane protein/ubiquinone/menaquinone biosynthesis C-methylase UbiE